MRALDVDLCANVVKSFLTMNGPCSLKRPKREEPPGPPWSQRSTGAVSELYWSKKAVISRPHVMILQIINKGVLTRDLFSKTIAEAFGIRGCFY